MTMSDRSSVNTNVFLSTTARQLSRSGLRPDRGQIEDLPYLGRSVAQPLLLGTCWKKRETAFLLTAVAFALALPGSATAAETKQVEAAYTSHPVVIDGRLDDPIWSEVPQYRLSPSVAGNGERKALHNLGTVRFARDDRFLYLVANFEDGDVVAEGDADGLLHFRMGDVCEVFLKPAGQPWYCELYVTPKGHQSSFVWPSGGRRLPSNFISTNELSVAATIQGTLNNPGDTDKGWTAELAVPISFLEKSGGKFEPGADWTILIGRYNYSIDLDEVELSSMPALSRLDFHLTKEYATLNIGAAGPSRVGRRN